MAAVQAGDWVVLFGTPEEMLLARMVAGEASQFKCGKFYHDDVIGQPWGTRVYDRCDRRRTSVVLRMTPELRTNCLSHRTQVVYEADLAMISMYLGCIGGAFIVESGTGSGSATLTFARNVGPRGVVHTFENNQTRYLHAVREFEALGVQNVVCHHADVYANGFEGVADAVADGVFLDLPCPWLALSHAHRVLKPAQFVVLFSPCHEQLTESHVALMKMGYHDIRAFEIILKGWAVLTQSDMERKMSRALKAQADNAAALQKPVAEQRPPANESRFGVPQNVFFQLNTRGHTGYVLVARKPPSDESDVALYIADAPSRFRPHHTPKSKKPRLE